MMFLDGYIGAPPTVTVCSFVICANEGAAAPNARAVAKVASTRRGYCMTLSRLVRVGPSAGVTARATGERGARMQMRNYRFVSLPTAMMSLLGAPVRDPPGSSSETASE